MAKLPIWPVLSITVAVIFISGVWLLTRQAVPPPAVAKTTTTTKAGALSVNELLLHPEDHLGAVTVTGTVAMVTPRQSFVLLNTCTSCGKNCVNLEVTIRWTQAAPAVKQAAEVNGVVAKTAKGFAFTANRVKELP